MVNDKMCILQSILSIRVSYMEQEFNWFESTRDHIGFDHPSPCAEWSLISSGGLAIVGLVRGRP